MKGGAGPFAGLWVNASKVLHEAGAYCLPEEPPVPAREWKNK